MLAWQVTHLRVLGQAATFQTLSILLLLLLLKQLHLTVRMYVCTLDTSAIKHFNNILFQTWHISLTRSLFLHLAHARCSFTCP
jgi:hypothetical protein